MLFYSPVKSDTEPGDSTVLTNFRQVVVYPSDLAYLEILSDQRGDKGGVSRRLAYRSQRGGLIGQIREFAGHLFRLHQLLAGCEEATIFHFDDTGNRVFTLAGAAYCALRGVPTVWHDHGFGDDKNQRWRRAMHSLCRTADEASTKMTDAAVLPELAEYQKMRKSRAVPRAIIYGDFDNETVRFLVRKMFELVKHKYPRTEFSLLSLTNPGRKWLDDGEEVTVRAPRSREEMQGLFRDADMVVLLSAGGLNDFFARRAEAAGYPVIINGKKLFSGQEKTRHIKAIRDSYSSLADEIIKLADDEAYYRRFTERA
jgi:hypothetical protein